MNDSGNHCIFCDIVTGKAPADKVYEDELVVAFWDRNPVRPIHILIVPREHISTLNDVPKDNHILSHVGQVAGRIAKKFDVYESGYRVVINVNKGGGQVVFHLHVHLIANKDE